jgi:hypothetical protein
MSRHSGRTHLPPTFEAERGVIVKRALIALAVVTAMLSTSAAFAVDAEAARKAYWTESKAEKRLKQRYGAIRRAWCVGTSARYRVIRGRWYYTQFSCSTWASDGELEVVLYPTGKRSFYVHALW